MRKRVLVIGPSSKTRGGITSVIESHRESNTWNKWNCVWIETHIDRSSFLKVVYFLTGYIKMLLYMPKTRFVHIHLSEPVSAIRKCFFLITAKIFRKKCIIHLHAFSTETTINGPYKILYKYIFNQSYLIITLSEFWKREIDTFLKEHNKTHILYNPSPRILNLESTQKSNEILYVGTLNGRKGYSDLITAFANVSQRFSDWKLIFAGNGEIDKAQDLARLLGIEHKIIFKGWVNGTDKQALFRSAKVFCLPSYAEGFPMAVIEAWAYKLPVLTTPVGGLSDVLINNVNALVFDPGDTSKLSKYLGMVMGDQQLRERLSHASENLIKNNFDLELVSKNLDHIYSECNRPNQF